MPSWVHNVTFPFIEFHEIPVGQFLQPIKVPLNGTITIWCIHHSSQFCATCELAEAALCPAVLVINEDIQQYLPQDLGYTTSY